MCLWMTASLVEFQDLVDVGYSDHPPVSVSLLD